MRSTGPGATTCSCPRAGSGWAQWAEQVTLTDGIVENLHFHGYCLGLRSNEERWPAVDHMLMSKARECHIKWAVAEQVFKVRQPATHKPAALGQTVSVTVLLDRYVGPGADPAL